MSYNRNMDLREELLQAGIEEINAYGANGLSLRRVATACHVSTAAPYKHFKDKKEFIAAIIDYVNSRPGVLRGQWSRSVSWPPAAPIPGAGWWMWRWLMCDFSWKSPTTGRF